MQRGFNPSARMKEFLMDLKVKTRYSRGVTLLIMIFFTINGYFYFHYPLINNL